MKPNVVKYGQYHTPAWAMEILFDDHFSDLGSSDVVWEPTCGIGNGLSAIPSHIKCFGTEIDESLANRARMRTGRHVIVGDCRTVDLPKDMNITAVFGNPPFSLSVFIGLLDRCRNILKFGHRAGFIIPSYFLQTSRTVRNIAKDWSISQEIIPRDLFPNLSKPLIFGTFTRDRFPVLVGFRLFSETADMKQLSDSMYDLFANKVNGVRSVWKSAVMTVLNELGGEADLKSIYRSIEGRRPTGNSFWKEQVRKVLQTDSFVKVKEGVYANAKIMTA